MVSINEVRASNSSLASLGSGLVAVFVGGTSGIGETTAREFVRNTIAPTIYLIGRSSEAANKLKEEFKGINPQGRVNFIQSDVSLLRNVDRACEEIVRKESKVNLLFCSAGVMTFKGRDETPEGLDKKLSIHYYARFRFTSLLLPLLTKAAEAGELSRNITVLSAGEEGGIDLDDLSLKHGYSANTCRKHACSMNSLASIYLSPQYPQTSFIHTFPGAVNTGLLRTWPGFVKNGLAVLASPWMVPVKEAGERHLYAATSGKFGPRKLKDGGDGEEAGEGISGNGAYLLSWNGEPRYNGKVLREYLQSGVHKKVWEHTSEVYEKICVEGGKY